jgi:hypothetical protein
MRATGLSLLFVAAALGCDGPIPNDALVGDEPDVNSTAEDLRDDGRTFFVYANQRVCVTAPCPSHTVITPGGVRFDVAYVIVEPGAERAYRLLDRGGLVTRGEVLNGSWLPGTRGPGLRISEAGAAARNYLVAEHHDDEAYPYCTVATRDVNHEVDGVDLDGLVPTAMNIPQDVDTLVAGEWATKGFLTRSDTGETVLYASRAAGKTRAFYVKSSGIACVTVPCPIWDVYTADGTGLGNAARLDLTFMLRSDAETAAVHDALFRKGGFVLGYLEQGSWYRGPGPTLLVARLLDRAP